MNRKLLASLLALPLLMQADVKLPSIFSDHAVLARSAKTPVFGKADPGEAVTVSVAGLTQSTKADANGKWRVNFNLQNAPEGPFELKINGKNAITLKDILVGEVWLCSGQSNMGFQVRSEQNAKNIIANSKNSKIRLFKISLRSSVKPLDDVRGTWKVCDPTTVPSFSAVGYLFGRDVQAVIKKPVGLIDNAWGGSAAESWMTMDALSKTGEKSVTWSQRTWDTYVNYDTNAANYIAEYEKWLASVGRTEPTENQPPQNATWKKNVRITGSRYRGNAVLWFKTTLDLSENDVKRNYRIQAGQLGAPVAFFLDGKQIAKTTHKHAVYGQWATATIKANTVKPGKHELLVRVWCTDDSHRTHYRAARLNGKEVGNIWEMTYTDLPKLTPEQAKARPIRPDFLADANKVPALLYNALIYPILPYAINGCVWYQGCTNAGRYDTYPAVIQGMINEWRKGFESDFPFYYCQLANFQAKNSDPNNVGWANIRRGQEGALALPKTGQAILIDVGEARDIHPIDKETVGARLAAIALNKDYGFKDLPYSGPVAKKTTVEGNKIRVAFDFVHGGLVAKQLPENYWIVKVRNQEEKLVRNSPNSQIEGFAIAGADGKFVWADAVIDGDTVVVSSPKVANPVKVRYAWQSNPTCNLYNKAGFPAAPFEK